MVAGADPWRNDLPVCRVHPESARVRKHVEGALVGLLRLAQGGEAGAREAVLVDCIDSVAGLVEARQHHASRPLVGVLEKFDPARIIEALASGADGVIALSDPPDVWRECLHVVLGGEFQELATIECGHLVSPWRCARNARPRARNGERAGSRCGLRSPDIAGVCCAP